MHAAITPTSGKLPTYYRELIRVHNLVRSSRPPLPAAWEGTWIRYILLYKAKHTAPS